MMITKGTANIINTNAGNINNNRFEESDELL